MDGVGLTKEKKYNALYNAKTPNLDRIMKAYPTAQMYTSGREVGLPEGQMGNSEVGHINIGAGRVVYQEAMKITKSIEDRRFL